jgi:hypothetical protein
MINRINIYKAILLVLLTLVLIFDIGSGVKVTFALLTICVLLLNSKKLLYFRDFILFIFPILSGIIFGLNTSKGLDIIKDIFYLISPMLYLLTGAALYRKVSLKFLLQAIIVLGILITFKKALVNVSYAGLMGLTNPFVARYGSGFRGEPTPAIATGLLLILNCFLLR